MQQSFFVDIDLLREVRAKCLERGERLSDVLDALLRAWLEHVKREASEASAANEVKSEQEV